MLTMALGVMSPVLAQIGQGGSPLALMNGLEMRDVPVVHPVPFSTSLVPDQGPDRAEGPQVPFDAALLGLDVDVLAAGKWDVLGDGARVCRLQIASENAFGLELFFGEIDLPPGAVLYVHGADGGEVLGGFTAATVHGGKGFATDRTKGDRCIVEVDLPSWVPPGQATVRISGVGHTYRPFDIAADPCEVDVVCSPEGDNWADERDGVVRIRVVEGGSIGYCSGSLVNNVAQDCTPYILTALHCGLGASSSDFPLWKFYFRYERPQCGSGNASVGKVMTGCTQRANSNDGGGANGSDFLLVELMDPVPGSYGPYWNGWDAGGAVSGSGVSIHHPNGDEKKISTYTTNIQTTSYAWNGPQSHWLVHWSGTTNGHGVTEGGSSGSPLFDATGHIIGTLTGGLSYCNSAQHPNGQNQPDYYGKMSYHWSSNPNSTSQKLKAWLDPQNSGTLAMDGSRDPCGMYVGVSEQVTGPIAFDWFPVPADERISAVIPTTVDVRSIELIDALGRSVAIEHSLQGVRLDLNTAAVPSGCYAVRGMGRGGAGIPLGRLVIQH